MENKINLTVFVKEEAEGGYSVHCMELNVSSQGETIEEAVENIKEAVELYIESAKDMGMESEVLEQLGIKQDDLKQEYIYPKLMTANIPIEVSV